jgi:hypothetical protein
VREDDLRHDRREATDLDVGGHVHMRQQHRPSPDAGAATDARSRMNDCRVALVVEPEPVGDRATADVVAGPPDADEDLGVGVVMDGDGRAEDRHAADRAAVERRIVVEEPEEPPGRRDVVDGVDGLRGLPRKAARADDQEVVNRHVTRFFSRVTFSFRVIQRAGARRSFVARRRVQSRKLAPICRVAGVKWDA